MPNTPLIVLGALAATSGVFYQGFLKSKLELFGVWREIEPTGNNECTTVPALQACEDIALHQPTGNLYLACSTPTSRTHWTPAVDRLNVTGRSTSDYVALYDPVKNAYTRLQVEGFHSPRGLNLHGLDVVPSSTDPSLLWVYLINHRPPLEGDAYEVGADSCVEVFTTRVGDSTLTHVKTVEDPTVVVTPNDIVGAADGSGFWFTNDHGSRRGFTRTLEALGLRSGCSVGYCSLQDGCKYAVRDMAGANGITRDKNDAFFVANHKDAEVRVFDRQSDNSLVLADVIKTDMPTDNLSVDNHGSVWAAGLPKLGKIMFKHIPDPSVKVPSTALRISLNTAHSSYFGDKYKVEKAFEDDGDLATGSTSVAYDTEHKRLFMSGVAAPALTSCMLDLS